MHNNIWDHFHGTKYKLDSCKPKTCLTVHNIRCKFYVEKVSSY